MDRVVEFTGSQPDHIKGRALIRKQWLEYGRKNIEFSRRMGPEKRRV